MCVCVSQVPSEAALRDVSASHGEQDEKVKAKKGIKGHSRHRVESRQQGTLNRHKESEEHRIEGEYKISFSAKNFG